jgi:hypothetical protein
MKESVREEVVEHCVLSAWLSFAPHLQSWTGDSSAGAEILADWLAACSPRYALRGEELLRALVSAPWRIAPSPALSGGEGCLQFILEVRGVSWQVRVGQGGGATHVERLAPAAAAT